jgi:aminobenzoyl-glutamate utilization protein A
MKRGLTAVVGILHGRRPGPTIAYRFDMDALPIVESKELNHLPTQFDFRSHHEGIMHSCGHDGHTAIGLKLAEEMAYKNFAGTLKLIFQPAEEGGRGAYAMVKKGVVDDVDALFCMHLGLNLPSREICAGAIDFLASTKMTAYFTGISAHAAFAPEKGRNALLGAATALLNIHALPRFSAADTRINVGALNGGPAANIVPSHARMTIETRSTSHEVNQELERRVRGIIAHSATMHELEHEVKVIGKAIVAVCDLELVSLVEQEARKLPGVHSIKKNHPFCASEDATFLMKRVEERGGKATYMVIGTSLPAPHHNEKFDIEEGALSLTVQLLEQLACRMLTE